MTKTEVLFKSQREHFGDPSKTTDDGLVAISDEMNTDILLEAYSHGIFPWPHGDYPTLWFSPEQRGVIKFENFHLSKSFRRFLNKHEFSISYNKDFESVIRKCAEVPRAGEDGTWINEHMLNNYIQFHKDGYAHSVECWFKGDLVGGLYGVYVGGVFSGESMFHLKSNASKLCLWAIVKKLQSQGIKWMDIQMVTELTHSFGGEYIERDKFLDMVSAQQAHCSALQI